MSRLFLLGAALLFVLGCQQEMPSSEEALSAEEITQITEEIELMSEDMGSLIESLDAEAEASFQSEHFTSVMDGREAGKQELLEEARATYNNLISKELVSAVFKTDVLARNVALNIGDAKIRVVFMQDGEEQAIEVGSKVTTVLVKEDGEWKQYRTHVSTVPLE